MGKAKMFKIHSVDTFSNVYQNKSFREDFLTRSDGSHWLSKGRWSEDVFRNSTPIVLELACGKGDYTMALSALNPDKNYIGVDIKGARIYTGAKAALENNRTNVAFARLRIENILNFFAPAEISEIWITFPDPYPGKSAARHRLTYSRFLAYYKSILAPGGLVHLKTDNLPLFQYSAESVKEFGGEMNYYKEDIYASPLDYDYLEVKTFYEKQHLSNGRTINYMNFRLP